MRKSRRELLAGFGGLTGPAPVQHSGSHQPLSLWAASSAGEVLPARGDFTIPDDVTYIKCAFTRPMPIAAAQAIRNYVDYRADPDLALKQRVDIKSEFAGLINAKPSEINFVPKTTTGENLVVNGLGQTFDLVRSGIPISVLDIDSNVSTFHLCLIFKIKRQEDRD